MSNKSCLKEFAKYSILNVLGMIGLSCYILADTFFISNRVGADGLTALNLAIPVYNVFHGCGLMLGMGGATKYSIYRSQGNDSNADAIFTNTIRTGLLFGVIFASIGIFLSRPLAILLGADDKVLEMTNIYLRIILIFSPFFILNDIMISFVRNDGNPNLSMMAMLIGSFANIIFDYIFIYPLNLGIFGAVLATGFAPIIGLIISMQHIFRNKNNFHYVRNPFNFQMMLHSLSLGLPSLITEISSGVVIITFNMTILKLIGNVGVASYGVITNISLVVISMYTGISQGVQPLVSRFYGSNDNKSISKVFRYSIVTIIVLSILIYISMFMFATPITNIFNSEHNLLLQQIATTGLKLYFLAVLFVGFNIVISVFLTSTDRPIPAHIISLLRGLILIVPMTIILSKILGITGVWLSFPITEFIVSILSLILYLKRNES